MRRGDDEGSGNDHVVDVARRPLAGDAPVRPREEAGVPLDVGRAERAAEELVEVVQLLEGWRGDVGMVGDQVEPPGRTGLLDADAHEIGRRRPLARRWGRRLDQLDRPRPPLGDSPSARHQAASSTRDLHGPGGWPARAPAVAAWPHPADHRGRGGLDPRAITSSGRRARPVGSITIWSMRSFGSSKRKVRVRVALGQLDLRPEGAAEAVAAEHEQGVVAVGDLAGPRPGCSA